MSGWKKALIRSARGPGLENGVANIDLILTNDPRWRGRVAYDLFGARVMWRREPVDGWLPRGNAHTGRPWEDVDTTQLRAWLSREYSLHVRPGDVNDAVDMVARRRCFHPIREQLSSVEWDGNPRIDTWLVRLCGADDTAYVREVSAKFLISAVARVFQPGCQADHVLVLEGLKGLGKSTLVKALAGNPTWVSEGITDMGLEGKKLLRAKWLIELPEMDHISGTRLTQQRAFITTWVDTYRDSYARRTGDYPRQCVFISNANPPYDYLPEPDRRYWPVRVHRVWLKHVRAERAQLWAEALHRYRAGELWHITDKDVRRDAAQEQLDRTSVDPWAAHVEKALRKKVNWTLHGFTNGDLYPLLGIEVGQTTRPIERRLNAVLNGLGFLQARSRKLGDRRMLWFDAKHLPRHGRPGANDALGRPREKAGRKKGHLPTGGST